MLVKLDDDGNPREASGGKEPLSQLNIAFAQMVQYKIKELRNETPTCLAPLKTNAQRWLGESFLTRKIIKTTSVTRQERAFETLCAEYLQKQPKGDKAVMSVLQHFGKPESHELLRSDQIIRVLNQLVIHTTDYAIATAALDLLVRWHRSSAHIIRQAALPQIREDEFATVQEYNAPVGPLPVYRELAVLLDVDEDAARLGELAKLVAAMSGRCSMCGGLGYEVRRGAMMGNTNGNGGLMFGGQYPCSPCEGTGTDSSVIALRTFIREKLDAK